MKCHDLLPPPFSELLLQSTMACGVECALGSAVLAVTALRFMPTPGKKPENLSTVQCSAAAETLLCYQHWPRPKPNTSPYRLLWGEWTPSQPDPFGVMILDDEWDHVRKNSLLYWRGHFLSSHPDLVQKIVVLHTTGVEMFCFTCWNSVRCKTRFFPKHSWCMNWSRWPLGSNSTSYLWALVLESFYTLLWFYCSSKWCRRARKSLKSKILGSGT